MFEFIKKLRRTPKEDSRAFRLEMAARLDGRIVKYVTERRDDVDIIIGREGSLTLRNGEMILLSSADIVFRCRAEDLRASELLSLDGAILSGPDLEHSGAERTVIAYYKYYR